MEQSQISVQRKVVRWCQLAQSKTWFMFSSHFYLILQFLDKKEVFDHIISVLSISFNGLPMSNLLSPDSLAWLYGPSCVVLYPAFSVYLGLSKLEYWKCLAVSSITYTLKTCLFCSSLGYFSSFPISLLSASANI